MLIQHKAGLRLALAGLVFALGAAPAKAQTTVFSNFGPGVPAFDTVDRYVIAGPTSSFGSAVSQGEGFTVSASGYLSTINIALSNDGGPNNAHLFLADGSSGVPGLVLESFTLTGLPPAGTTYTPEVIISANNPFLTAGTTYYLYDAEPGAQVTEWNFNSQGEKGPHFRTRPDGSVNISTATQGAFSVQVNPAPVPEASTTVSLGLLLALGVSGLVIATKRRRSSASR